MAGTHYLLFRQVKDYLRAHPDATDEEIAEAVGIDPADAETVELVAGAVRMVVRSEDWRAGIG